MNRDEAQELCSAGPPGLHPGGDGPGRLLRADHRPDRADHEQGDVAIIAGGPSRACRREAEQLQERVKRDGFGPTMEAMAYTWFNRLVAIRYMELHGYLDHGYRVLSHPDPAKPTPEILEQAEQSNCRA